MTLERKDSSCDEVAVDDSPQTNQAGLPRIDFDPLAWNQQKRRIAARLFGTESEPTYFQHYELREELGRGGMGVVYAAYDRELDRKVAIKTVQAQGDEGLQQRLVREAQAMAKLSHPNIVPVFEFEIVDGLAFIVMEYVDGVTLEQWLTSERRSQAEIMTMFQAAGEGLSAAHDGGVIHRDFKPANVMVGRDGRVRVMDFGLAILEPSREKTLTWAGSESAPAPVQRAGTPAYMSPEQFRGDWTDAASDQFSFCVALYEALYRERPFAGATLEDRYSAIQSGNVRPPSARSNVPPTLRATILRGLAPHPSERFPSMRVLLDALAETATFGEREVSEPQPQPLAQQPRTRSRLVFGAGLLASFLAAGALQYVLSDSGTAPMEAMRVVTCRARIVKTWQDTRIVEVEVIELKSGEIMPAEISEGRIIIFECPALASIEVTITVLFVDGTRATWTSVTVQPYFDTALDPNQAEVSGSPELANAQSRAGISEPNRVDEPDEPTEQSSEQSSEHVPAGAAPPVDGPTPARTTKSPSKPPVAVECKDDTELSTCARGCDDGRVDSCIMLGDRYRHGAGGASKDHQKAADYYLSACKLGDETACDLIAELRFDNEKLEYYFSRACPHGGVNTCMELGRLYEGRKEYKQALESYQRGCMRGNSTSCNNLGNLYRYGKGTPSDAAQAVAMFEKACANGKASASACSALGEIYQNGEGSVAVDLTASKTYYGFACKKGHADACDAVEVQE